ncbi:response regulator [Erythrobacter sp. R86502]|uniref:response regulator n=1 Tax=Erythrobacter sp. R86502 TaxID=3093846 RepID=UPI0036D2EFFA
MAVNSTGQRRDLNHAEGLKRILVVEDEVMIAIDIAQMLKGSGHAVVGPCIRKSDAEKLLAEMAFDGALLDFNLGNGDTSESIASALRNHQVPFAFLTGNNANTITGLQSSDTVISKPVSRTLILEAIAQW